jgi:PAS domain S-box-containing protein
LRHSEFSRAIRRFQKKTTAFLRTLESSRSVPRTHEQVFEALSTSLEELRVAEEEMSLRDERLVALGSALTRERERYADLFNLAPDAYLVTDSNGLIEAANHTAREHFGGKARRLEGKPLQTLLAESDRRACRDLLQRLRRGDSVRDWPATLQPKRGRQTIFVSANICPLKDAGGRITGLLWLMRDTTQWVKTQERITLYQKQLRSLACEVLLAEERERRRLATALHDDLNQSIALCQIKLRLLLQSPGTVGVATPLCEIGKVLEEADRATRALIFELSPPLLHDLGLKSAAQWLVEEMHRRYGLDATLVCHGEVDRLDERLRIVLFRSLRELLVNVAKHSGTLRAKVDVRRLEDLVRITVEDEGHGFEPSEPAPGREGRGFGIFSVREHIASIGGRMDIRSAPGRGTTVTLVSPTSMDREKGTAEDDDPTPDR